MSAVLSQHNTVSWLKWRWGNDTEVFLYYQLALARVLSNTLSWCLATFLMFKGDICHWQVLEDSSGCAAGNEKFLEKWETFLELTSIQISCICTVPYQKQSFPSIRPFSYRSFFCTAGVCPSCPGRRRGYSLRQFITGLNRDHSLSNSHLQPTWSCQLALCAWQC